MEDVLRHNCGILVVHSIDDLVNLGPYIQHRGREAAGVFAKSNERVDVFKWVGGVDVFDKETLSQIFSPDRKYHTFGLHVRYATRGRKDKILDDAHPHVIGGKRYNLGNHIYIEDCDAAIIHNGQVGGEVFNDLDRSCMLTGCDSELLLHYYKQFGEKKILENIPGSYTLAIADKNRDEIIVLRDPLGMKPGVLGFKNNKAIVASENSLFFAGKKNDAEFDHDLKPGKVYYIKSDGNVNSEIVVSDPKRQYCFMEWNYIASINSVLNHLGVFPVRNYHGEMLAELVNPAGFDFVTYVPRAPKPAARRYSMLTGLSFIQAFYKPRDIRTFLGSTEKEREQLSKEHIFPSIEYFPNNDKSIKGKRVLSIDDSTIRGNNARRIRDMIYNDLKVEYAMIANYTPKIGVMGQDGIARGCLYGVDMPPDDNFIIRPKISGISSKFERTDEEINEAMGIDIFFPPVENMLRVFERVGMPREKLCTYCIGGPKPF